MEIFMQNPNTDQFEEWLKKSIIDLYEKNKHCDFFKKSHEGNQITFYLPNNREIRVYLTTTNDNWQSLNPL